MGCCGKNDGKKYSGKEWDSGKGEDSVILDFAKVIGLGSGSFMNASTDKPSEPAKGEKGKKKEEAPKSKGGDNGIHLLSDMDFNKLASLFFEPHEKTSDHRVEELSEQLVKSAEERVGLEAEQIIALDALIEAVPSLRLSPEGEYPGFIDAVDEAVKYIETMRGTVKALAKLVAEQ